MSTGKSTDVAQQITRSSLAGPADLAKLLGCIARGDRDAVAPLYRATSLKLFGIILRILRRKDLAEEVLQEVYVKVWEHASAFEPTKASAITWMAAIARNRALDEARKRGPTLVMNVPGMFDIADQAALAPERISMTEDLRRSNLPISMDSPGKS